MRIKFISLFFLLLFCKLTASAQDDLLSLVDSAQAPEPVSATFKNGHLINQHTIETPGQRSLDFRISHRFGDLKSGAYNAFGIDGPATIRLSLDYSYDGRLVFGIGRTSQEKLVDGSIKYKILRQKTSGMPVSMVWISSAFYTFEKAPDQNGFNKYHYPVNRLSYSHELIIGRKFNPELSLQVAPMLIHYNIVDMMDDKNDVIALAGAGRYKITKRFAIIAETAICLNNYSPSKKYYNSTGLGLEIETGGHVFQVVFSNSAGLTESQFVPHTTTAWSKGGIKLGFNISRVFHI